MLLHKVMRVLRLFTLDRKELAVTEVANLLEWPKSTTSRSLSAMEAAGFLDRSVESGRYRVSMQLAAVGEMAKQATSLQQMARPALERLTAATGETSNLVVLVDSEGVNVEAIESPQPVMHMGSVGRRFPLHASAACKALLAWRTDNEVLSLLQLPLVRCTPATIANPEVLLRELADVRERGYAVNWMELEDDLVAVGAPVRDHRSDVVAAISISAPASRVPRDTLPAIGAHVMGAARALSRDLGCPSC
jgi:DNA-binding IclR family transcriptional regulator